MKYFLFSLSVILGTDFFNQRLYKMWGNIITILYLFVAFANAIPVNSDSGESGDDELVYVFNIYAVRNTKTQHVAKMLSDETLMKVPDNFEPIGSILLADDEDEPVTMEDVGDFLEEIGLTVEQLNDEDKFRVIEIKFDDDFDGFDRIMMDWVEAAILLQEQGVIVSWTVANGSIIFTVEFDESRDYVNREFNLQDIGEMFETEGYAVEYVTVDGIIKSTKIKVHSVDEEMKETVAPTTMKSSIGDKSERNENKIEKNNEKINHRKIEIDEQFQTLDFSTRAESLNKIRRRRSTCPECKTVVAIKAYMHEHGAH